MFLEMNFAKMSTGNAKKVFYICVKNMRVYVLVRSMTRHVIGDLHVRNYRYNIA